MYDYMIEEMADAIAIELHIDNNDVLRVLHRYWQDKIAHVWRADHIVQCAFNMGKPILMEHVVGLLDEVFQFHDSDEGIRWNMMEDVLRDYRLDFNRLSVEQHDEVRGVFKVWRQGNIIAHQIGLFPDETIGNLTKAIALAKTLAMETPDVPIMLGCESWHTRAVEPWLTVTQTNETLLIEQKGANMHAVKPNQQVRILTVQIAVAADDDPDSVADEMSALLSENGICLETNHILDWHYLTEYQPTVTAGDDPEEGEVFGLLDFHLTITTPEE